MSLKRRTAYHGATVERIFNTLNKGEAIGTLGAFIAHYEKHITRGRRLLPLQPKDGEIVKHLRASKNYSATARAFGTTVARVCGAVHRVALFVS